MLASVIYFCHCFQIVVPMPTFDSQSKKPLAKTHKEKEKVWKRKRPRAKTIKKNTNSNQKTNLKLTVLNNTKLRHL